MKGKKRSKNGGGRAKGDIQSAQYHFVWTGNLATGNASLPMNASGLATVSTRFLAEADAWRDYRYTSCRYKIHPNGTRAAAQTAGWVPLSDTAPSTVAQIAELKASSVLAMSSTTPTPWASVPRSDLAGPFPWYKVIDGTPDTSEEIPARFQVSGGSTDPFTVEFVIGIQFKESLPPANTPMELEMLRGMRELRKQAALEEYKKRTVSALGLLSPSLPATTGLSSSRLQSQVGVTPGGL